MPRCPYCELSSEGTPPKVVADILATHIERCPLNPRNQLEQAKDKT